MATIVFTKGSVSINGVDLSSGVIAATVTVNAGNVEETAMGDTYRQRKANLLDWNASVDLNQDYITGFIDATVFPLVGTTPFSCTFKADTAATTGSNPSYTGVALLQDYIPIGGSLGELLKTRVTLIGAGTLTRNIT